MGFTFNAKEVFEMAVDIEKNGKKFYETATEKVKSAAAKKIFSYLAKEETKHQALFQSLLDRIVSGESMFKTINENEDYHLYLKALADSRVFKSATDVTKFCKTIEDELDAVLKAVQFEKDSILLFTEMAKMAAGKKDKSDIEILVGEEQQHILRLYQFLREEEV